MIPADKDAPTVVAVLDLPTKSLPTLLRKNNGNNPLYELLQPFFNSDKYRLFLLSEEDLAFMEDPIETWPGEDRERNLAPKIKVEWEQGDPFNKFCPNQYPAGCVAIASAQAMTLTGVPYTNTGFDFKDIAKFKNRNYQKDYPELVDPVAALIRIIGADVNMDYGPWASGAKTQVAVRNIFQIRLGMNMSNDPKDIKKTLRNHKKSIVMVSSRTTPTEENPYGDGHCYLIDGYDYCGQYDKKKAYLHVNFGWGPGSNGLFLQDLFAPRFTTHAPEQFPEQWTCYCIY